MIITAALAWWNEPPEALDKLVRSLEGVCDRLIAVDGRWAHMPGNRVYSPLPEVNAIMLAAAAVGIDCAVHRTPSGSVGGWDSQVEKRDYLMRRAAEGSDWIVIVDGDTHVSHCDAGRLRSALAGAVEDVALLEVTNVGGGVRATWPRQRRLVYRAAAGPSVATAHNGYRSADGRWLNGDTDFVTLEPAVDVSAWLKLTHNIDSRGRERRGAQGDYYAARAGAGEEAWATA